MIYTNKLNLPKAFERAVSSDYRYTPHRYSVTSLNNGSLMNYLQRVHEDEIEQDVSDMIWLLFGTSVHSLLEKYADEGTAEQKLAKDLVLVDGKKKYPVTISGIFDVHEVNGRIDDYKTASCYKVIYNDWKDYEEQLTGYAWLLEQCTGEVVRTGRDIAILKDWTMDKYRQDPDKLPPSPVYVHEFDITEVMKTQWFDKAYSKMLEIEKFLETGNPTSHCTATERWANPATYAVKKKKDDKRAIRLFDKLEDAQNYSKDGKYVGNIIEKRPEKNRRCEDYCIVNKFCPFYKDYMETREQLEYIEKDHKDGEEDERPRAGFII